MTTIMCLPKEIIAYILRYNDINFEDILSFSSTCKTFQEMIQDNWFWKTKIYQRCPTARRRFKTDERQKFIDKLNLIEIIKAGITYTKKLRHFVSLIFDNKLWITHKKELQNVLLLTAENSMIYCFLLDELNGIINSEKWQPGCNLTTRYNLILIVDCVKQYCLTYKIIEFIKMPREKQLFERLLTIVIQYIQPHVSYTVIDVWLNDIAQEVKARLLCTHPAHSIFMTSAENISFWRENNIDQNFWNPTETTQIMHILEKFIFSELDHKLHQLWISLCLEDIDYISEYFRRDILIFTYYSVARRLGIHCILKFIPGKDLVIAWKPEIDIKYLSLKEILEEDLDKFQDAEFLFVKKEFHLSYPSNIGRGICNFGRLHLLSYFYISIIQKMIRPFYEKLRDCRSVNIPKYKFTVLSNLLQTFTYHENIKNIDVTIYENITNTIKIRSDDAVRNRPNRNNNNIRFAVGMIVTHLQYNINHDGVIIGWDCQNNREEFLQKLKNNFFFPYLCYNYTNHLCSHTRVSDYADQPHYIILAKDNRICYVPQDFIFICPPKIIDNIEIGRFFSRFEGTYYVANESLAYDYPDDANAMFKILPNYLTLS